MKGKETTVHLLATLYTHLNNTLDEAEFEDAEEALTELVDLLKGVYPQFNQDLHDCLTYTTMHVTRRLIDGDL